MHFADLSEEDQIVRVTEALLTATGSNPTPRDLRALSTVALEFIQALQLALDDLPRPGPARESKTSSAVYAWDPRDHASRR